MALPKLFKTKERKAASPEFKKKSETPAKKAAVAKEKVSTPHKAAGASLKNDAVTVEATRVLRHPRVTEKAAMLAERYNQYVFNIIPHATKLQVKEAIERLYHVNVEGVRIINVPSKRARLGRYLGRTNAQRKAIVKIQQGQKIDVLPT